MTPYAHISNYTERQKRKDECPECDGKGIVDGKKYGRAHPIVCCDGCDGYGFLRPKKDREDA